MSYVVPQGVPQMLREQADLHLYPNIVDLNEKQGFAIIDNLDGINDVTKTVDNPVIRLIKAIAYVILGALVMGLTFHTGIGIGLGAGIIAIGIHDGYKAALAINQREGMKERVVRPAKFRELQKTADKEARRGPVPAPQGYPQGIQMLPMPYQQMPHGYPPVPSAPVPMSGYAGLPTFSTP